MTHDEVRLVAPAKLTLSLRVLGRRSDGLHELDAEMVSIDLADDIVVRSGGEGIEVVDPEGAPYPGVPTGSANLVHPALELVGRQAWVRIRKRVPPGGGLGGGSSDAGAILRWAGWRDLAAAARLGSDVPFCVVGGRARVGGAGALVARAAFRPMSFLVLLPPLRVDTGAVYRAFDQMTDRERTDPATDYPNDLTAAALAVEPRLAVWQDALARFSGARPVLAGSGSTWFVPDDGDVQLAGTATGTHGEEFLHVDGARGRVLRVVTVPAGREGAGTTSRRDAASESL